ncbi:MAG: ParB/RepB/Spo0J family partition protein [Oscillospiraceae bacterium]|nr:ParB/RepB/Spo0J family partition protein [Oscillospiraceae bacterium]
MAKAQGGLGRGLNALFGNSLLDKTHEVNDKNVEEVKKEIKEEIKGETIKHIKIIDIEPNKNQPRKIFEEESMNELANSIKKYGVIQPIVVSKNGDYYEIIAGERRWRAAKIAGLKELPAVIMEADDRKKREIALVENIQREDLNPIEKSRSIKALLDEYDLTQEEVGEILGKKRSTITNSLRLLNLDERVIQFALEGKLTEGHCKSLLSIEKKEKQYEMALEIINSGGTIRALEKKIKDKRKKRDIYTGHAAVIRDIEDKFRNFFGTKVKIDANEKRGKIVIQYSSNAELERLLDLVK